MRVSDDQVKDGLALRNAFLLRRQQIRQMRHAKWAQGLPIPGRYVIASGTSTAQSSPICYQMLILSAGSVGLLHELHWMQEYESLLQQEYECFTIFMVCMSFGVSMKLAC